MQKYRIAVSPLAQSDMIDIGSYIMLDLQEPELALKILAHIEKAMQSLVQMPQRQPLLKNPRLAHIAARMLAVRGYSIFYMVDEIKNEVNIYRILYRRRDWESLLWPQ